MLKTKLVEFCVLFLYWFRQHEVIFIGMSKKIAELWAKLNAKNWTCGNLNQSVLAHHLANCHIFEESETKVVLQELGRYQNISVNYLFHA